VLNPVKQENQAGKALVIYCILASGVTLHVSRACGARASDKVVTAISGFYELCERIDDLMVDRGLQMNDKCDSRWIYTVDSSESQTEYSGSCRRNEHCSRPTPCRMGSLESTIS